MIVICAVAVLTRGFDRRWQQPHVHIIMMLLMVLCGGCNDGRCCAPIVSPQISNPQALRNQMRRSWCRSSYRSSCLAPLRRSRESCPGRGHPVLPSKNCCDRMVTMVMTRQRMMARLVKRKKKKKILQSSSAARTLTRQHFEWGGQPGFLSRSGPGRLLSCLTGFHSAVPGREFLGFTTSLERDKPI